MLKIKVTCSWSNNDEIKKRLIDQFGNQESLSDVQIMSEGDDYDVIIAFGYITEHPINDKPIFVFPQEPTWTGAHQKGFNGINNIKVFGFSKHHYYPIDVVIETISHMFYGGRGPWEEGFDFWNYNNLINNTFSKTKGICSFVSNRGKDDLSHPDGCTYGERVDLVEKINKSVPFVDFYGWGNDGNLKPFVHKKSEAIKDYKFCLTIENSHEKNYVSEKFYDCILTNTIPIYYGCSNIKDYWSENGYFLLDNIKDHQYIINKLKWIDENQDKIYNQMLPEILKMKKKYFEEFNLLKKIKKEYYELNKLNC